ncbi:uncharacterized protein [Dysidea avara]|uniref:uncharacterized protein n=1 Tax=Dysidea avara TaxID=196820 RepID=UPI003322D997
MMANTSRKRPNAETSEEVNKKNVAGIAQAGMLPEGSFQYVMGPTGPMLASNGHLVPIITPVQWLPQQQQVQQPQPMEITMTTVTNNSTASITTSKKPQQQKGPIIFTMPTTPQTTQQLQLQQHQKTIDSFNERHLDVEEHFRRSLGLLSNSTAAATASTNSLSNSNEPSTQASTNVVNVTMAPNSHTFVASGTPLLNAALQQQQQITLANTAAAVYAAQQKEYISTDHVSTETVVTPTITTPTKSQRNPHNIENLIATSTPTHTSTTPVTRDHSSSQLTASSYEPPSHDQQVKTSDVHVPTAVAATTNPYATILLTPGGLYHQAAAAGALNYTTPMISMDPNLLALLVPQMNAQAATLLQQGNTTLSSEDVAKMLQGVPIAAAVPAAGNTAVENNNEAAMVQRSNFKPVYLVNNSETGHHQLRSVSGSNIVTLATNMDNGSGGSLSTQNSSSQIVPTPMNTDDGGGQIMETTPVPTQQQRSVHSEVSSVSDSVEDHFARALGGNWRTKFN